MASIYTYLHVANDFGGPKNVPLVGVPVIWRDIPG